MAKIKQELHPEGWTPEGCDDEELYEHTKSTKCFCGEKKEPLVSFCTACYKAIPQHIKEDLWLPWADGFTDIYEDCIEYLKERTTRLECRTSTSSSPTYTSSSGKAKKKAIGTPFLTPEESKSVSAQETSLHSAYLTWQCGNIF